jgi:predicted transcriptional regulator
LALLRILIGQGRQTVATVAGWLNKVYPTTKNHLDALALLGLVHKDELDMGEEDDQRVRRYYTLNPDIEAVLTAEPPSC